MVSKGSLASRTETDSFRANITVASRLASILRNIRLHLQQTIHWQKYAQQTAFSGIKVDNDIGRRQAEGTFCSLALHMSCLEKFYFSSVWGEEDLMPIEEEEEKGGETHAARRGALSSARKEADKWRRSTILFFTLLDS